MFPNIAALPDEVASARAGDEVVPDADVVMDRAFTLDAAPQAVWPWLVQLGKRRAGWYLPRSVERLVPPNHRAVRTINLAWQQLRAGDVIPDYGGRHETFEAVIVHRPHVLVYRSLRGGVNVSWSMTLTARTGLGPAGPDATRVHLRLRLGPVRRKWLAESAGELVDVLTIAGLAAGLRERLR